MYNVAATTELYTLSYTTLFRSRTCILYALVSSHSKKRLAPYQTFFSHLPSPSMTHFFWASVSAYQRSEEHTSELQSRLHLVCRLLLEKKNILCRALTRTTTMRL